MARLSDLNDRFIDAFRHGSWEQLKPLLAPDFSFLNGTTGEVWPIDRYAADLDGHPLETIQFDEVRIHVAGDVAVVSARTSSRPATHNRFIDTYARRDGQWLCVHACVWPIVSRDAT